MTRRGWIALTAFGLTFTGVGLLAVGVSDLADPEPARPPAERVKATERARAQRALPARTAVAQADAGVPAAVVAAADRLTPAKQVAQLFLVGFSGTTATDPFFSELARRGWGGVVLTRENFLTPDQVAGLAGEVAVTAREAGRVVPLVAAVDVPGFEPAPQSPGDGIAAAREAARTAAARLRAGGVTLAFAPVADVGVDAAEGTFGDDAERVARLTSAAVAGWRAGGVVAAPEHFPGQGAATQDPLEGPASVGLGAAELAARDLLPFKAVAARARAIVVSSAAFSAYDPATPGVLTAAVARGLLRDDLHFKGVAMSDDLAGAAAATGGTVAEAAVAALQAGVDMLQVPDAEEREAAYAAVLAAVEKGTIPPARIREAVLRVLTLKRAAGLLGTAEAAGTATATPTATPP